MRKILSVFIIFLLVSMGYAFPSYCQNTGTSSQIGKEDLRLWNGKATSFSRRTSTGGVISLTPVGNTVDVAAVYGAFTDTAISNALNALGTSTSALELGPGAWTIANSITVSKTLIIDSGALLTIAAGKTLTITGAFEAGLYQIFTGTGTVVFGAGSTLQVRPEWFGGGSAGATAANSAGTNVIVSFASGDATPSVSTGVPVYQTANATSTTITNFTNGFKGQEFWLISKDVNTTITFGSNILGHGGTNWTMSVGDTLHCVYDGSVWYGAIGPSAAATVTGSSTPGLQSAVGVAGGTVSNTTFSYYVGEITTEDVSGNLGKISNLSGTVNSATTGALGRDLGTLISSCFYHFFAIVKTDQTSPTIIMSPVAGGKASGLTVNVGTVSSGAITAFNTTPTAGGTGWKVGDTFRVTTGDKTAVGIVTATDKSSAGLPNVPGVVTAISSTPVYGGTPTTGGYITGTGQATTVTPTLPANYTQMAYFGSCYVDGSGHFVNFQQTGRRVVLPRVSLGSLSANTNTAVSLASVIPTTASRITGTLIVTGAGAAFLYNDSGSAFGPSVMSSGSGNGGYFDYFVVTPQALYYKVDAGSSVVLYVTAFEY
jgi:filamentous hemagglutinin family protein